MARERQHLGPNATGALEAWMRGAGGADEATIALAYQELRGIAAALFAREHSPHTLQPTALVHEAYLRLSKGRQTAFKNREQFFGVAAMVMRRILVDHARAKKAGRRAGVHVTMDIGLPDRSPVDVFVLDDVLERLARAHPRKSQVAELRCVGGLSMEAIAELLSVSLSTVEKDWQFARSWLRRELSGLTRPGSP